MGLKTYSAKAIGGPNENGWSFVHDFEPEDPQKLNLRGKFYAVISASSGGEGVDYTTIGREILSRLHEEYFGNLEKEAFDALSAAVDKVSKEFAEKFLHLEIGVGSFVDGVFYTAVVGGAQAGVFRNNMLAKILVSQGMETISASGYPQNEDIFLLGTQAFFANFADGVVKANLEGKDIASAAENFTLAIFSKEESAKIATIMIAFNDKGEAISDLLKTPADEPSRPEFAPKDYFSGFVGKAKNIFSGITNKIPRREIYVKQTIVESSPQDNNKKTTLTVGVILLAILILSIFFGIRQKLEKDKRSSYQDSLTQATHSLEEAKSLATLDPTRSRELLLESKKTVEDLLAKGIKDDQVNSLKSEIDAVKEDLLGEYRVAPELFIDLALLSSGFSVDRMAASDDNVAVLDIKGKKVATVSLETKKAETVAGPTDISGDPVDVGIYTDRVYLSTKDKIYEVGNELKEAASTNGVENHLLYIYTGNIYLLDKSNSKVFRYQGVESGFTEAKEWLGTGQSFDFTKVTSWTIDGSVWMSYSYGDIEKLTQGVQQNFSLPKMDPTVSEIKSIYSNEELTGIYLLDTQNKRVVVIDKEGKLLATYLDDSLSKANNVVASEKLKKIFFSTSEGKLYSIEIKHLK